MHAPTPPMWWQTIQRHSKTETLPEDATNIVVAYWKKRAPLECYTIPKLTELFHPHAVIVQLHRDAEKRCAHIRLENVDQCQRVVHALHGQVLDGGKRLYIDYTTTLQQGLAHPNQSRLANLVRPTKSGPVPGVRGLYLVLDIVSEKEEQELVDQVDKENWEMSIHRVQPNKRRVQHFGYKFNYSSLRADSVPTEPFPEWIRNAVLARLVEGTRRFARFPSEQEAANWTADQLTINEYKPGQGIAPHVDTHSAFQGPIVSLSVGSDVGMKFVSYYLEKQRKATEVEILLPRRSLLIMSGEARYGFLHGIAQRKTDLIEDAVVQRNRRISLTFRQVNLTDNPCRGCGFPQLCDSQQKTMIKK